MKRIAATITLLALLASLAPPANAQGSQGRPGSFGNSSRKTNNYAMGSSAFTTNQRRPGVKAAGLGGLAEIHGQTGRNGLPVTSLDSFVLNAGGSADQIYGDEGVDGPPPFMEFTKGHRINTGITNNGSGLTTGHGSYMPDAWGGDEFVDGPEWSRSGSNGGNAQHWSQGVYTGANPGTSYNLDQYRNNNIPTNYNNSMPDAETGEVNNMPYYLGSEGEYRGDMGPTAFPVPRPTGTQQTGTDPGSGF